MPTTIEQLELEVQSKSTSAVSGIEALERSLQTLKGVTKGGMGLRSVASSVRNLNAALDELNSSNISKISNLATGLASLKSISSIKLSSTIATQIVDIGYAAESISDVDFSGISEMTKALAPLSSISRAGGLDSVIKTLRNLPDTVDTVNDLDLSTFKTQVDSLASSLAPLSTQLNTISSAFSHLPANMQKVVTTTNSLSAANQKASNSYVNLWAKAKMAITGLKQAAGVVSGWINSSNQYIEDLNLFNVSMGRYAEEAQNYANAAGEALGIDPGEFMRNQGTFNTIIKGFGVVEDRAYTMSKNLTQLGYDISSFYNISFENAMQKLQSGVSGELEPLRRLGYDLSVARLQEEALALGIDKKVSAMTQAEKSELRYHAIMTQVTDAQGDMARTLNAPANQLRVLEAQLKQCSKALGNVFLPLLSAALPYVIALAKMIRYLADCVASFFGFKLRDFTSSMDSVSSSVGGISDGVGDVTDGLNKATKAAKKLKSITLGIDELNILSKDTDSADTGGSGSGSGSGVSGGSGLGIDLPTYTFFDENAISEANKIFESMKSHLDEILSVVGVIGTAIASWKVAQSVVKLVDKLNGLKGKGSLYSIGFAITGLGLFLDAWDKIKEAIRDIKENGPDLDNCTKLISGFAESLGVAFAALGKLKLAGAMFVISGLSGMVSSIADMVKNGPNWDNATNLVRNLGLFLSGIGLLTQNQSLTSGGFMLTGISLLVRNLGDVLNAFRTGDWSGVDKVEVAAGVALVIGSALMKFKQLKEASAALGGSEAIKGMSSTMGEMGEAIGGSSGGGLNGTLKTLAQNLLWGIAIIAEVSFAALLVVGAIAVLGLELDLVAKAWEPVLENSDTVVEALGLGTAALVLVGLAAAGLGDLGAPIAGQIGLGIAILVEVSAATDLFVGEIALVGVLLNKVYEAWTPVRENGKTIAEDIGIGTGLLIGIGVVTAALGVATVASAGLLPVAIGLGTALLVELAAATVAFCDSLVDVADELNDPLYPALVDLNGNLPDLTDKMSDFVDFMTGFALEVVRYTKSDAVAGIAATVDTIIGWFTRDPIDKLASDVDKIYDQTVDLNEKLSVAVPELKTATDLLTSYRDFLSKMEDLTGSEVKLSDGMFVNMKEVGRNLVTGFVDGIKSKSGEFSDAANTLISGFKSTLSSKAKDCQTGMTSWAKNLKDWFTKSSYGGINAETWKGYANDIINGFVGAISNNYNSSKSSLVTWGNQVKSWFNKPDGKPLQSEFEEIGKNVIQGFINGSSDNKLWKAAKEKMEQFGREIIQSGKNGLDEGSPSKAFREIGEYAVVGFNIGFSDTMESSYSLMEQWTDGINSYTPAVNLAVDTSQLASMDNLSRVNRTVLADVESSYTITTEDFSDGLETFYHEYMEPTLKEMAYDMKRQADKNEQTVVKLGNRAVNDAVTIQRKANGYSFA